MIQLLIGGCSRSGTTLLGGMLGGHPEAITTPESPFKIHPLAASYRRRGGHLRESDIAAVIADWFFAIWGIRVSVAELISGQPAPTPASVMQRLVQFYASRHGKGRFRYWVDHTPANIRYAATLLDCFPEARILHLVRDGRAVWPQLSSWPPADGALPPAPLALRRPVHRPAPFRFPATAVPGAPSLRAGPLSIVRTLERYPS